MFHINNVIQAFHRYLNDDTKKYKLFLNPIVVCLLITVIVILVEFLYLHQYISIDQDVDKIELGAKLFIYVFLATFVLMFAHSYVTNLSMKHKMSDVTRDHIVNSTISGAYELDRNIVVK